MEPIWDLCCPTLVRYPGGGGGHELAEMDKPEIDFLRKQKEGEKGGGG